jgi:predicted nucleic acid-binding protein
MARLVLTDASPLIGLARVDGLAWLGALFVEVWLPVEVRREVLSGIATADERAIRGAESAGILRAWPEMSPSIPDLPDLDEGEAACIRLGLAQEGPVLILMDERAAGLACRRDGGGDRHGPGAWLDCFGT